MNELVNQLLTLAGIVSGIVVTLRGFTATRAHGDVANAALRADVMTAIDKRTVPLEEYKAFVRERHHAENAAREKNIAQDLKILELEKELIATRTELRTMREVARSDLASAVSIPKEKA